MDNKPVSFTRVVGDDERPFRYVAVGGSITTGHAAPVPSEGGWASLVARALEPRFPGGLEFLNRGVSGTDSAFAAVRIADHARGADLVVLEFGVNDQWLDPTVRRQSYEGCLRQVLSLPGRPRVLCLFLCEQGGPSRGQAADQRVVADHYGVPWVDFGAWLRARGDAGQARWEEGWNPADPIHPNAAGHAWIAEAVLEGLVPALGAPSPAPESPRDLRDPLYTSDWQFVRAWDGSIPGEWWSTGWEAGGDAHGEWVAHGGAPSGWRTRNGGAELRVAVTGQAVGVLHPESEHYRDGEARIEGRTETVVLKGHVTLRQGYLGWAFGALGRGLGGGSHTAVLRPQAGEGAGDRPFHVSAVLGIGVDEPGTGLVPGAAGTGPTAPPADLPLTWTGRFDPADLPSARFGWALTRLSGRFTGPALGLSFGEVTQRNWFQVSVDGRGRSFEVSAGTARELSLVGLGEGEHRLEVVKRSEGIFGSAVLAGLALAPGERWLAPRPRPGLRLEFYGDSITAGACNLDGAVDQYDDLATHDPLLGYAALTARRLGAEVVNLAVSGTGLTCSWNPLLMGDVFDRAAPDLQAPVIRADREPQVVVLNLGQNDYGFPRSEGRPLSPEYGDRLEALVRALRQRYPDAWIVGALGGMTALEESPDLRRQWASAWARLRRDDPRLRSFFFQAASAAHPRVDVHARLADELTAYLDREVLPHLETPLH